MRNTASYLRKLWKIQSLTLVSYSIHCAESRGGQTESWYTLRKKRYDGLMSHSHIGKIPGRGSSPIFVRGCAISGFDIPPFNKAEKLILTPCLVAARSPGWVCWRAHLAGTRQYVSWIWICIRIRFQCFCANTPTYVFPERHYIVTCESGMVNIGLKWLLYGITQLLAHINAYLTTCRCIVGRTGVELSIYCGRWCRPN